jgi:leader peptidase (prepilin peptidase) / N-methyltransferase
VALLPLPHYFNKRNGVKMTGLVLIVGLIIGSFLNVCIYRIPRKESIAWPSSHCPSCRYVLKWYDLFPVVTYIALRGKCRQCRSNISIQYPLVELLTGISFVLVYLKFGLSWLLLSKLVFIILLIVIGIIDLEHMIIPNTIVVFGSLLGLAFTFLPGSPSLVLALVSGLGASLFFLLIWFFKGMGMGDVKLAFMLGLFLGCPNITISIFLAALLGSVSGIILISLKGGSRKTPVPFGLFLAIGSIITVFYGQEIVTWYLTFIGLY